MIPKDCMNGWVVVQFSYPKFGGAIMKIKGSHRRLNIFSISISDILVSGLNGRL